MARPVAKICDINDSKELWKVFVRVHHKWKVLSNNREHFEMIFMDKAGGDIHVVVPAAHVSLFDDKSALDHTYFVSNFKVPPNLLAFRPSSHKFLVNIGYSQTASGAKKQQLNMVLRDPRNDTINCTLWESYVEQFLKFNQEHGDDSVPTFLML
ncbi:uncharacterized protein LOC131661804 [Vicia villosa]|uniref:uncharacterized protein LOC131661804 n=1 Tax=Vicia villosa TaxID=3911 RepID=UPI00273C48F8|nr:uncharacterized protein LOC131661804 [Vicia villosa]